MVGTLVQFSAILSSMAHKHFVIWRNFFTLNFGAHQHEITKEHLTRYTLYLQSMDTTKARYFLLVQNRAKKLCNSASLV